MFCFSEWQDRLILLTSTSLFYKKESIKDV